MKRFLTVAAVVVAMTIVAAQAPPNLAGKWTLVPDANTPQGGMGGLGQEATITQDATTLSITRTTQMGTFTSNYKLDGSETKNTLSIQGNSIDQFSTAKWDAGKLRLNTKMDFGGNPVEISTVLSLEPSGTLVVESTRPDFQGGGGPVTTKMSYKKN